MASSDDSTTCGGLFEVLEEAYQKWIPNAEEAAFPAVVPKIADEEIWEFLQDSVKKDQDAIASTAVGVVRYEKTSIQKRIVTYFIHLLHFFARKPVRMSMRLYKDVSIYANEGNVMVNDYYPDFCELRARDKRNFGRVLDIHIWRVFWTSFRDNAEHPSKQKECTRALLQMAEDCIEFSQVLSVCTLGCCCLVRDAMFERGKSFPGEADFDSRAFFHFVIPYVENYLDKRGSCPYNSWQKNISKKERFEANQFIHCKFFESFKLALLTMTSLKRDDEVRTSSRQAIRETRGPPLLQEAKRITISELCDSFNREDKGSLVNCVFTMLEYQWAYNRQQLVGKKLYENGTLAELEASQLEPFFKRVVEKIFMQAVSCSDGSASTLKRVKFDDICLTLKPNMELYGKHSSNVLSYRKKNEMGTTSTSGPHVSASSQANGEVP